MESKDIKEALNVVGEYFGDVKDACMEGFYKIETPRLVSMEEIVRCINLYSILNGVEKIRGRKLEVLAYYLRDGFSKETKKRVMKVTGITDSNLNNINFELRKLGVVDLIGDSQTSSEVNGDLLRFKNFIVDDKGKYILIKIKD